jgi:hypothetical protein
MRWKILFGEVKRFFIPFAMARDATFSYNQQVPGCQKPLQEDIDDSLLK